MLNWLLVDDDYLVLLTFVVKNKRINILVNTQLAASFVLHIRSKK